MTDQASNPDAPPVYTENGIGVYRASSIGMCERALIAARMSMTPADAPAWMQERYQQGHEAEPRILAAVEDQLDGQVGMRQKRVEIPVGTFAVIRAHLDGVWTPPDREDANLADAWVEALGDQEVVEAKAFAKSLMAKWRQGLGSFWAAAPYYRDQLTVQMAATGLPAIYAVMDKETGEVEIRLIPEPPGDIDAIIAKVLRIELAGRKGALPRECDARTYPCPFYYLPGHSKEAKPVAVDDAAEFETLAQEACDAREDKQRAEARAKEANRQLLEYMVAKDADKLEGSGYTANRVSSSSTSFNRDAMKQDGVYDKYLVKREFQYAKAARKE